MIHCPGPIGHGVELYDSERESLADAVIAELKLETMWAVEVDYVGNRTEPYPTEAEARERAAEIRADDPETRARVVYRIQSDWNGVDG